jgi:hypothetical protein
MRSTHMHIPYSLFVVRVAPIFGGMNKNLKIIQEALDHYHVWKVFKC